PIEASVQRGPRGFNRRNNAFRRLAIAGIGHRFAATAPSVRFQLDRDYDRLSLAAAADRERSRQRPTLDAYGEIHAEDYTLRKASPASAAAMLAKSCGAGLRGVQAAISLWRSNGRTSSASGGSVLTWSDHAIISNRPSACSASAVQLSTQSPQFI